MTQRVTLQEAAEKLELSLRSIRRLVHEGILAVTDENGTKTVSLDDLTAFQELQYQKVSLPDIALLSKQTAAKTTSLERQLKRLTEFIGVDIPVLSTDPNDVLSRYAEVEILLAEELLPLSDVSFIVKWSRVFYAMGEEQFDLIAAHTADPEPWAKPMKLATRMFEEKPKHHDLELDHAYRYLLFGRRFMRQAAYFYVRRQYGTHPANRMFKEVTGGFSYKILSMAFPSN